jgi:hypothetical protein
MTTSEVLEAVARFCASTAKIDKLHANALEELTGLVRNLHDRVLVLEARVATLERLDAFDHDAAVVKSEAKPLKQPNWERKP